MIATFFTYFLIFFFIARLIGGIGGNRVSFLAKTTVRQDALLASILALISVLIISVAY